MIAALGGCAPSEVVIDLPRLPEGVDRVAVLLLESGGAVVAASGLVPAGAAAQRFDVTEDDDLAAAWVVGHDARSLPGSLRPDAETLVADRLRVAVGLERALPAPAWVGRGARDGQVMAVSTSSEVAPPLTADWLSRCPLVLPTGKGLVDIGCKEQACPATAEQVGCQIVIDASACTYGRAVIALSSDGALSVDPASQLGACDGGAAGPLPGSRVLSCDFRRGSTCPVTLYPEATGPRFALEEVVVGDVQVTRPDFARPPFGALPGAATSGERLFVSALDTAVDKAACVDVPGRLVVVDTPSRAVVSTSGAPPCLLHLVDDPAAARGVSQVLGVSRGASGWALGRFDADGRRVSGRALGLSPDAVVVDLAVDPRTAAQPELLLLVRTATTTFVQLRDARTLEARAAFALGPIDARSPILTPTLFAVLEDDADQLWVYDRGRGTRTLFYDVRGNNPDEGMARARAFGADFVITASTRLGGVKVARPGMLRADPSRPFEGHLQAYGVGPWAADPSLLLVGLTGIFDDFRLGLMPERTEAYVTLFDPGRVALLPHMMQVGRGPVEHVLGTPEGEGVWVTLPWESKVVYVRPPR